MTRHGGRVYFLANDALGKATTGRAEARPSKCASNVRGGTVGKHAHPTYPRWAGMPTLRCRGVGVFAEGQDDADRFEGGADDQDRDDDDRVGDQALLDAGGQGQGFVVGEPP
jgi:hypothetical protein